jgi:hypothetical protein
MLTHSFLVMPQCLISLLGKDLLHKLGAFLYIPSLASTTIFLLQEVSDDYPLPKPLPDSPRALEPDHPLINPIVWETTKPQAACHHKPTLISFKNLASYINSPPISKHSLEIPYFQLSTIFWKGVTTNWTFKTTLNKPTIETHLDWIKLLSFALLKIRAMPKKPF